MSLLEQLQLADKEEKDSGSDAGEQLAQDPRPAEKPATRAKRAPAAKPAAKTTPPKPRAKTTATLAREVAEDLTTAFEVGASLWETRDPHCAGAVKAQARPVADALVAILERNERWLRAFAIAENGVWFFQLLNLVQAVGPIVKAVAAHHGPGAPARQGSAVDEGGDVPGGVDLSAFPAFSGVPRAHSA